MGALPILQTLVKENNVIPNCTHGIHIVRVNNGSDVILGGQLMNKAIDGFTRFGVQ